MSSKGFSYYLNSPAPSACDTQQSHNVPHGAIWCGCEGDYKRHRHKHQKGWSHYRVRIDISGGLPDAYQQEYNKHSQHLFRWVQTYFLHKGRKQSIQEKGGEYWMLTIETIYKNIAQGKMLRSWGDINLLFHIVHQSLRLLPIVLKPALKHPHWL